MSQCFDNNNTFRNLVSFPSWEEIANIVAEHPGYSTRDSESTAYSSDRSSEDSASVEFRGSDDSVAAALLPGMDDDVVFKIGAATAFQVGFFHNIVDADRFEVRWEDEPRFASTGDCGAVYFFRSGRRFIPFAIHVASTGDEGKNRRLSVGVGITETMIFVNEADPQNAFLIDFSGLEAHPKCISYYADA